MATEKRGAIGQVIQELGGKRFKVRMQEDGREVVAYLAGKLVMKRINIGLMDKVEVLLDPAGGEASNRIIWRV